MQSILNTIKKVCNVAEEDTSFDDVLIVYINNVFMILNQMGIGPSNGFRIKDKSDAWTDYISDDPNNESVKIFIGLKVRLVFDPPQNSAVRDAFNETIKELEWRLNAIADNKNVE